MTTIKEALQKGSALLSFIPGAHFEARVLMCHILNMPHAKVIIEEERPLAEAEKDKYFKAIYRRAKGEPSAYITRTREFFGRNFLVNKNVLVPRLDTETLVEAIIEDLEPSSNCNMLELGVGSGCIAITLLKAFPHAKITAVDISQAAIRVARQNAKLHEVTKQLSFLKSNWYEKVRGKFAIIYSNPPYISKLSKLQLELSYEPQIALFAEKKGLESYYQIAAKAEEFLSNDGCLYVEIPKNKEGTISKIFAQNKMLLSKSYKDLSGTVRCLKFKLALKGT
jgi:release factor glutamine methyltransferase